MQTFLLFALIIASVVLMESLHLELQPPFGAGILSAAEGAAAVSAAS